MYTLWCSEEQAEILYQNVYMITFDIYQKKCTLFEIYSFFCGGQHVNSNLYNGYYTKKKDIGDKLIN